MTKEEHLEYRRKYREEHREEINANRRYNYKKNPEKTLARNKAWRDEHKDDPEYKARRKASYYKWYEKNREKLNAYARERYRKKKEQDYAKKSDNERRT